MSMKENIDITRGNKKPIDVRIPLKIRKMSNDCSSYEDSEYQETNFSPLR